MCVIGSGHGPLDYLPRVIAGFTDVQFHRVDLVCKGNGEEFEPDHFVAADVATDGGCPIKAVNGR